MRTTKPDLIEAMFSDEAALIPYPYVEVTQMGRKELEPEVKAMLESIKKHCPNYNEFDANKFAKFVEKEKGRIYKIRFGREYSPVVYITPMQNVFENSHDARQKNAISLGKSACKMLKPDEFCLKVESAVATFDKDNKVVELGHDEGATTFSMRLWFD